MNYKNLIAQRNGNGQTYVSPFNQLEKQLLSVFAERPGWGGGFSGNASGARIVRGVWSESDDAYRYSLDLPGVKSKDIDVSLKEGVVGITAARKAVGAGSAEGESVTYSSRVSVPENVEVENLTATFEDGVLSLEFPRAKAAQARKISVKELK